jgi:tetratricopeptide (TPR) repeat protein
MSRWVGFLVVLLACVPAVGAVAQDREAARREFDEATRQFEQGHYALALRGFERSYELMQGDPRAPLILYNIGRAQEALGRLQDAIASFERYLADAPSDAPYRENTIDLLRDLRARVADAPPAPSPSPSAPSATPSGGLGALDVTGLVLLGVGAAAGLASIPTGIVALDGRATLDRECGQERVCSPDQQGLIDDTRTMAIVTDVLWIAGVSVVAIGATLLAIGRATESPVSASAMCTDTGCVGTVQGRF